MAFLQYGHTWVSSTIDLHIAAYLNKNLVGTECAKQLGKPFIESVYMTCRPLLSSQD